MSRNKRVSPLHRKFNHALLLFCGAIFFALFTFIRLFRQSSVAVLDVDGTAEAAVLSESEQRILSELFPKLDEDGNGLWSLKEIEIWIVQRVTEHMRSAVKENIFLFTAIDARPRDGLISWEEYHSWFLRKNGVIAKNDRSILPKKNMTRSIKEKISWDRAQWTEAARSSPHHLSLDEFLSFRHPESSATSLLTRADDVMFQLDLDSDGVLMWDEFIQVTSPTVSIQHFFSKAAFLTFSTSDLLKKEFTAADKDETSAIDKNELVAYLDPKNPRQSRVEAEMLLQLADENGDANLNIEEVLHHGQSFLESKVVDAGKVFHDEF